MPHSLIVEFLIHPASYTTSQSIILKENLFGYEKQEKRLWQKSHIKIIKDDYEAERIHKSDEDVFK
jgi:hypothetical protein